MSTAVSAVTADLPTFTTAASEANGTNDNGIGPGRGASYFFGFLITFIILLFLFVGCGVATRRRLTARRREQLIREFGEGDTWVYDWYGNEQTRAVKPVWEERWIDINETPSVYRWAEVMPLAMKIISSTIKSESNAANDIEKRPDEPSAAPPSTNPAPNPFPSFPFRTWMSPSLRHSHTTEDVTPEPRVSTPLLGRPSEALITVLVSMPRNHFTQQPPEFQLGIAREPIKGNLSS